MITKTYTIVLAAIAVLFFSCASTKNGGSNKGWVSLFDGKTLNGWRANKNEGNFSVVDGKLAVKGDVAHLFYEGPVANHNFKNFEFKAKVMTLPKANSGIFIHTAYQPNSWPSVGYEVQVNNSHSDWRRTGSLYGVSDVKEVSVKDEEWYTTYVKVQDKHITIMINDKTVVDFTEPESVSSNSSIKRKLSSGTLAIQAHDAGSRVFYKDIYVRLLP
ncbi:MAG TPA: DUF1080 domain-containing protein [Pedobacter sp.]